MAIVIPVTHTDLYYGKSGVTHGVWSLVRDCRLKSRVESGYIELNSPVTEQAGLTRISLYSRPLTPGTCHLSANTRKRHFFPPDPPVLLS